MSAEPLQVVTSESELVGKVANAVQDSPIDWRLDMPPSD